MKFEKKLFIIISLLTLVFSIISQAKSDRLKDLVNLLNKAKQTYVSDLKLEVIAGKTGISFQEE